MACLYFGFIGALILFVFKTSLKKTETKCQKAQTGTYRY